MTAALFIGLAGLYLAPAASTAASPHGRCDLIEVYEDAHGAWRWIRKSDAPTCVSRGPFETRAAAELNAKANAGACDTILVIEDSIEF
jgi:hypothetical protein